MSAAAPGRPAVVRTVLRAIVPFVVVAASFALAASSVGADDFRAAVAGIRLETMLLLLGVSAFNYGARALRWFMLFRAIDPTAPGAAIAQMPRQLAIYLAGYAFTLTPGRAGEAIRVWMAARTFGTPADAGLSLVIADRLYDAVALTVILLVGAVVSANAGMAPLLMVAILLGTVVFLGWAASAPGFWDAMARAAPRLSRPAAAVRRTLLFLGKLSRPGKLTIFALPSLAGWTVQGLAPMILLRDMGISLGVLDSVLVFALATLVGGATFLPGGLGGFEATMIGLLAAKGVAFSTAAIATLIMRLTTLWFGVTIGILALVGWALRSSRRRDAQP